MVTDGLLVKIQTNFEEVKKQMMESPAGVPMCILTGKLAADRVLKKSRN